MNSHNCWFMELSKKLESEENERLVYVTNVNNAEALQGLKDFGYEVLVCRILPPDRILMMRKCDVQRNCPCEFVPFPAAEGKG